VRHGASFRDSARTSRFSNHDRSEPPTKNCSERFGRELHLSS
jgi:hypothetical protein